MEKSIELYKFVQNFEWGYSGNKGEEDVIL